MPRASWENARSPVGCQRPEGLSMTQISNEPAQARSERLAEKVLDAVIELVTRDGFSRLTVDAVVARSGTSRKFVYAHWPSKGTLVEAALLARLTPEQPVPDTGTLHGDLLALVGDLIAVQTRPAGQLFRQLVSEAERDPSLRPLLTDLMTHRRLASREVVLRAVARGELSPQPDPDLLLDAVGGIIHVRSLITRKPLRPSDASRVVDTVLNGFLPRR
jgi:AcrR family transcriptional regulator